LRCDSARGTRDWNNDIVQRRNAALGELLAQLGKSDQAPLTRRLTSFGATLSHKGRGFNQRFLRAI
jgi:hypothetical protein